MRGAQEIIDFLNESLGAELTSISQYFVHAKMCEDWGWERLAQHYRDESIEEMNDAEKLMERILKLEGRPAMLRMGGVELGNSPEEQLRLNLALEVEAVERYRRGIALALEHGDHATREILEEFLVSEENHVDWLETQLNVISEIGIERYLQTQIGD